MKEACEKRSELAHCSKILECADLGTVKSDRLAPAPRNLSGAQGNGAGRLVDCGFVSKQRKKQVNKKQSAGSTWPVRGAERQKSANGRASGQGAPQPVLVAAGLAVVQSIAIICFGIFLIVRELTGAENDSMVSDSGSGSFVGLGTALFIFIVFGFVIVGAWAMVKGKRWGRGAIILVELILAASSFQMFSGGSPLLGAVTLLSAALVIFLLMFVRSSTEWAAANF